MTDAQATCPYGAGPDRPGCGQPATALLGTVWYCPTHYAERKADYAWDDRCDRRFEALADKYGDCEERDDDD
jgi:hypothetical protein